jgi:photosystem II stability/assembly factor-like uncharacterized protein
MGAAFPTATHWVVLVDQCFPCQATIGTHTEWVAVTDDAGRAWTLQKTAMPVSSGSPTRSMVLSDNERDAWSTNGWVSHNGGLTWAKAKTPLAVIGDVVVVGNRVWAVGQVVPTGATRVLTGAVTGSALTPTTGQPFPSGFYPGALTSPASNTVYDQAWGPSGSAIKVTRDGGKTWRAVAPCGAREVGQVHAPLDLMTAFSVDRLFVLCAMKTLNPPTISSSFSFSTDGGTHWSQVPASKLLPEPAEPVSSSVAWSDDGQGDVIRTTNGGHSWSEVWTPIDHGDFPPGTLENLTASGSAAAFAVFEIDTSKGTYFLIRATANSGGIWHAVSVFTLPSAVSRPS